MRVLFGTSTVNHPNAKGRPALLGGTEFRKRDRFQALPFAVYPSFTEEYSALTLRNMLGTAEDWQPDVRKIL